MAKEKRDSGSLFDPYPGEDDDEATGSVVSSHADNEEYWKADAQWEVQQRASLWGETKRAAQPPKLPRRSVAYQVETHCKRAAIEGADYSLTAEQWRSWVKALGCRCVYCGEEMQRPIVEHVIPLSRGGDTSVYNVVPACGSCNSMKGSKTPDEWLGAELFARFVSKIMTANRADYLE